MDVRGLLVDIDGVLTVSWRALPGAVEAFDALVEAHDRVALLTNTTSRTRESIAGTLSREGFRVDPDRILTAPVLTAAHVARAHPGARCWLLSHGDVRADLAELDLVDPDDDGDVDVVILGGAGPEFGYEALNRAFGLLQRGARLVAMHRNLSWQTDAGLQLDSGAFLAGLERAAHTQAVVMGKPATIFFRAALDRIDVDPHHAVMVGDDVEADVAGAQRAGLTGVLVRTGKFRPALLRDASSAPDHVVDSIVDVPGLLAG